MRDFHPYTQILALIALALFCFIPALRFIHMIGILFLLYGFYRATNFPSMSVILTIISLGTRVGLAYYLASIPSIGVIGIWWSIPIGWALADIFGIVYYKRKIKQLHF